MCTLQRQVVHYPVCFEDTCLREHTQCCSRASDLGAPLPLGFLAISLVLGIQLMSDVIQSVTSAEGAPWCLISSWIFFRTIGLLLVLWRCITELMGDFFLESDSHRDSFSFLHICWGPVSGPQLEPGPLRQQVWCQMDTHTKKCKCNTVW